MSISLSAPRRPCYVQESLYLIKAAQEGDITPVRYLLQTGACPFYQKRISKKNVFHVVAENGDFKLLKLCLALLKKSCVQKAVRAKDCEGNTPLLKSIGSAQCFKRLIKAGADPTVQNNSGENLIHLIFIKYLDPFAHINNCLPQMKPFQVVRCLHQKDCLGQTPLAVAMHYFFRVVDKKSFARAIETLVVNYKADLWQTKYGLSVYEIGVIAEERSMMVKMAQLEPEFIPFYWMKAFSGACGIECPTLFVKGHKIEYGDYNGNLTFLEFYATIKAKREIFFALNDVQYQRLLLAIHNARAWDFDHTDSDDPAYVSSNFAAMAETLGRGSLVILSTGWDSHSIALVFYQSYLVICNRGEGFRKTTFEAFTVNLTCVTAALVRRLVYSQYSYQEGAALFYKELPKILRSKTDALTRSLSLISPKPSKEATCSISSRKAALRAALFLLCKDADKALLMSKNFSAHYREETLEKFKTSLSVFGKEIPSPYRSLLDKGTFLVEKAKKKYIARNVPEISYSF